MRTPIYWTKSLALVIYISKKCSREQSSLKLMIDSIAITEALTKELWLKRLIQRYRMRIAIKVPITIHIRTRSSFFPTSSPIQITMRIFKRFKEDNSTRKEWLSLKPRIKLGISSITRVWKSSRWRSSTLNKWGTSRRRRRSKDLLSSQIYRGRSRKAWVGLK